MTRLDAILAYKRDEVAALKRRGEAALMAAATAADPPRPFASAVLARAAQRHALICEVKRRSPSAGEIAAAADPARLAEAYVAGGATCISVLTDGPSFGGALADLAAVRARVAAPALRKDFMLDPAQVLEARAAGADAILIIMAAVDDARARELETSAAGLGMAVLVEVHDEAELDRALALASPLIGVNNRDLRSFVTDLSTTERLAPRVPADRVLVAESGVRLPADVTRLKAAGARAFLVGEALMRADDPQAAAAALAAAE